jgi:hypothetical protein
VTLKKVRDWVPDIVLLDIVCSGFDAHLVKPIAPELLADILR